MVERDLFDQSMHMDPTPPEAAVVIKILEEYVAKVEEMMEGFGKARQELQEWRKIFPKAPIRTPLWLQDPPEITVAAEQTITEVLDTLGTKNPLVGESNKCSVQTGLVILASRRQSK